ncbi:MULTISPECIES: hypothetical protein [Bacillales]|jgi:hypothetical protein|uniref:Arylsulfotransferase (ASST) n=1 Tax=Brevibacillus aydinogluensis TaxID=927786 RepID=A0AA48RII6_9BACL|nr:MULTISPECIES: hypothetical protein [Bacillales]REK61982.1 MAG: hypothetical protein DF221_14250 [Brevibacillus sp.]MBR8661601.1 hypothetical protein [Brevibacillus sp. NL20B1]MDT3417955.1 hypothetical protein [Brevibacillus aydinogluensis]NNV03657.1 hypothetical protein [Brevibacillus sp. MCWH]UFJ62948.1 hypothetical protein IRT44_09580 [Anoxybacillus sediminis]
MGRRTITIVAIAGVMVLAAFGIWYTQYDNHQMTTSNETDDEIIENKEMKTVEDGRTLINIEETPDVEINSVEEFSYPFQIEEYVVESPDFRWAPTAPQFVNDRVIAFDMDDSKLQQSFVGLFDRSSKKYEKIYSAPPFFIINSLVGIDNVLYWVEYDRNPSLELKWRIMSMDLGNKKIEMIKQGISQDGTDPPILRVYGKKVTWIEYEVENQIVTSKAMILHQDRQKAIEVIAETKLSEKDGRDGYYFAVQTPTDRGLVIQQSKYQNKDGKSQKSYVITLFPYDRSKAVDLLIGERIIDFNVHGNWFVWTEEGKVSVASLQDGKVKYRFSGKSKTLTNDTPFIKNDFLIYRYGMNRVFIANLKTGKHQGLLEEKIITTKLFRSGEYLSYGIIERNGQNSRMKFVVIK